MSKYKNMQLRYIGATEVILEDAIRHYEETNQELKKVLQLIKKFYELDPRKKINNSDSQYMALSDIHLRAYSLAGALRETIKEFMDETE